MIKIKFIPADFVSTKSLSEAYTDNGDCPLARACNRHFKATDAEVTPFYVTVGKKQYEIVGAFGFDDYKNAKNNFESGAKKTQSIKLERL